MTLTIELSPENERALQEIAQAQGHSPTDFAAQILISHLAPVASLLQRESRLHRGKQANVDAAFGLFAGEGTSSDEFLADKHADAQRELDKDLTR